MADDIEKRKTEVERLGRLVDRYAQSRSLGLWIPLLWVAINVVLLVALGGFVLIPVLTIGGAWAGLGLIAGYMVLSMWLGSWLTNRYGYRFYQKDGEIELEPERVPIWAWALFFVTSLGPAILIMIDLLQVRWALVITYLSYGWFLLFAGKKEKEEVLGVVYGSLILIVAGATAMGWLRPFGEGQWREHPFLVYLVTFMTCLVGVGVITVILVHMYNRKILRKIKEVRPFGEQQTSKSDS
jgi:hypothetical protein